MRLIDYLDKGAILGADAPCLGMGDKDLSYAQVQALSHRVARVLQGLGIRPGAKVAVLSGNDPIAFSCVFGISRAAAACCPLTHAAGVLCLPVMALGGRVVIMPRPDLGEFLRLIEQHRITHTFLPPTLIYMLLQHPQLEHTRLDSLQCFWYGAAPIAAARLE